MKENKYRLIIKLKEYIVLKKKQWVFLSYKIKSLNLEKIQNRDFFPQHWKLKLKKVLQKNQANNAII